MGTAGYMSPEQVQALRGDHRSDVFSFGAVLYEMISGARAFAKQTQVETLTAILREDPPPLPADTPQALPRIAARCLEKEPERRFQSMKDLAFALRTSSSATSSIHTAVAPIAKRNWLWPAAALSCLALVFVPRSEVRGNNLRLTPIARDKMAEWAPVFSPDGKSIAYLRGSQSKRQLVLRVLAEGEPVVLAESTVAISYHGLTRLSWSQDGAHIVYPDGNGLSQISVSGGTPRSIFPASVAAAIPRGSGMVIASGAGGTKVRLQVSDPAGSAPGPLAQYEIDTPSTIGASSLEFSPDGRHLALVFGGTVAIIDWPAATLRKTYSTEPVIRSFSWMPDSRHGIMAGMFRPGIQAIDTETGETRMLHTGNIGSASINPGGRAIAMTPWTLESDIVEFSMGGEKVRDLVSSVEAAQAPAWSPDGNKLTFRQYLTPGIAAILVRDLGAGTNQTVVRLPVRGTIPSPKFSPDGKRILYRDNGKLWTVLASGGIATPILETVATSLSCWSPDGNWILTESDGGLMKIPAGGGAPVKMEFRGVNRISTCTWKNGSIYGMDSAGLRRIPENGGPSVPLGDFAGAQISGISPDGATLYLLKTGANQLLAVDAQTGRLTKTVDIQAGGLIRGVSVHPDGKRLAVWVERTIGDIWMLEGFPLPTTGIERLFRKWKDPE